MTTDRRASRWSKLSDSKRYFVAGGVFGLSGLVFAVLALIFTVFVLETWSIACLVLSLLCLGVAAVFGVRVLKRFLARSRSTSRRLAAAERRNEALEAQITALRSEVQKVLGLYTIELHQRHAANQSLDNLQG